MNKNNLHLDTVIIDTVGCILVPHARYAIVETMHAQNYAGIAE